MVEAAASGSVSLVLAIMLMLAHENRNDEVRPAAAEAAPASAQVSEPATTTQPIRLPPPPAAEEPLDENVQTGHPKPVSHANEPVDQPAEIAVTPLQPRPVIPVTPEAPRPVQPLQPRVESTAPATPAEVPQTVAVADIAEGRTLLRLLEKGKGPLVEIAWPTSPNGRAALHARFAACYGMQTVLVGPGGKVFASGGTPGEPILLNDDRYSGFVRQPDGELPEVESRVIEGIRRQHGLANGSPARIFPRTVDAALFGGLGTVVGPDYLTRKLIRAHYRLVPEGVVVDRISSDGAPAEGGFILQPIGGARCR